MNMLKINTPKLLLFLILLLHVFILSKIMFFPYPEIFVYPYLTNNGLIPYKDIFDQHFPGLMFLPINFHYLGMVTVEAARIWMIGVAVITQVLIYLIGRQILKNEYKAITANFFYLLWHPLLEGWIPWLEVYQAIFYLPAFYFSYLFLEQNRKNYNLVILIGFFLSLALLFKQVTLPLAFLLFLFLLFKIKTTKIILTFALGFLPVPIIITLYFYFRGALIDMWYWTIWFNLTTFTQFGSKTGTFSHWLRILAVFGPILGLPFIKNTNLAILLVIFTIGSLAEAVSRFDFVHFQASLPFACFTLVIVISRFWPKNWFRILIVLYLLVHIIWLSKFYQGYLNDKIFFFDQQTLETASRIESYTFPKEHIYLFGPVPHLYFLSNTLPSGNIFVFQFPWFLMESEEKFLKVLKDDPPNLIVRDRTVNIEGWDIKDFAAKIDRHIDENYQTFDKVGNNEFMRKKIK
jgi:hypothetical protein